MAEQAKLQHPRTGDADARALSEGKHGDPFAHLGPHVRAHQRVLSALVPGAVRVWAMMADGSKARLAPNPAAQAVFDGVIAAGNYRLCARSAEGAEWEWDDPYRYGPVLGALDEHLIGEGAHQRLWQVLGAHPIRHEAAEGVHFAIWAPGARRVSVVGEFNLWNGLTHPMRRRGTTGVWEIFLPGVTEGAAYKFEILGADGQVGPLRADPVGFGGEHPPATASVVRRLGQHQWQDSDWMAGRGARQSVNAPMSVYEVHLGSWRRKPQEGNRPLSYAELAADLVPYVRDLGFTHIELMPVSEYPFDGSWGYQPVGLFAPTIRHGTPSEFANFVDVAHRVGLGVILDWVPGHFPSDAHGLARLDGTPLYEHADPKEGFHRDWNTLIYNYGRIEVANFLIANALYWLKEYHLDGLRVDAVASMLYRDYSRREGEWVPNRDGGRENYEAIAFLRRVNAACYAEHPGIAMIAEESTAFPGVTQPVDHGGLGFGYKWNMGWMNDTLAYLARDPIHRKYHHHQMTFSMHYAYSENFILPISHDEVVHGKGSMLSKMPGSQHEKFAGLRAAYACMWTHPGKKLLFMGQEFGQSAEWNHDRSLDWHEAGHRENQGLANLVRDLNQLYRNCPALHLHDSRPEGFDWLVVDDAANSVFAFLRKGEAGGPQLAVIANLTPMERHGYRLGLPREGHWAEILNTDGGIYGGGDRGNLGGVLAAEPGWNGRPFSATLTLPPLSVIILQSP